MTVVSNPWKLSSKACWRCLTPQPKKCMSLVTFVYFIAFFASHIGEARQRVGWGKRRDGSSWRPVTSQFSTKPWSRTYSLESEWGPMTTPLTVSRSLGSVGQRAKPSNSSTRTLCPPLRYTMLQHSSYRPSNFSILQSILLFSKRLTFLAWNFYHVSASYSINSKLLWKAWEGPSQSHPPISHGFISADLLLPVPAQAVLTMVAFSQVTGMPSAMIYLNEPPLTGGGHEMGNQRAYQ